MALNFFSCIKGRQFSINPKKNQVDRDFTKYKNSEVFSRSCKIPKKRINCFDSDMEQHPPSKRRKTEGGYRGEMDDWDDDDFDLQFTQADLEHIDTMASQAITHPTGNSNRITQVTHQQTACTNPNQSSSRAAPQNLTTPNPVSLPIGSRGSFVKPQNISSNNSSSSSRNTSLSFSSRNTSSSASYSSSSSYPVTPKSAGSHHSSSSLKSESSVEMAVSQLSRRPSIPPASHSDSQTQEVVSKSVHRDSKDINVQLQEAKKELSNKDGEIKILRDNLQKKEGEITQTKKERMQALDQHQREQSEREKNLQANIDRLSTQLQFKDRDIAELQGRCRSLESRQQPVEGGYVGSSPRKVPQHSPRPNKDKAHSPSSSFPTKHSFMADDRSPKAKARLSMLQDRSTKDTGTCTVLDTVTTPASSTPVTRCLRRRRLFLSVADHPGGVLNGAQLVSSLLDTSPNGGGVDQGIVGLLHTQTGSCDLQRLHFDRDSSSSMLSPLPNRPRPSDTKPAFKQLPCVGSSEHRTLALQGIQTLLLHNKQCGDDSFNRVGISILSNAAKSDAPVTKGVAHAPRITSDQELPTDHGAVLLLPLLADYLGHYLDLLSSAVEVSPQSPPSSRGSSSLDSSVESLSSSLSLLLRDSGLFANNLEALALAALSILHKLVSFCPSVRAVLLESPESHTNTSVRESGAVQVIEDRHGDVCTNFDTSISSSGSCSRSQVSDLEDIYLLRKIFSLANPGQGVIEDRHGDVCTNFDTSISSSGSCSRSQVSDLEDIYLLRKIFSLANPGQGAHKYSVRVVERALDILTVLATHLSEDQVPQLLPLLHSSVLANCIDCESDRSVVVRGMKLLTALVKFNSFVSSLYVGPDGCLLCLLYNVCSGTMVKVSSEYCLQASIQLFHCLYNIISVHKGGAVLLLQSDCRCSVQVIRTVVVVLHRLLLLYEEGEKDGLGSEGQENLLVQLRQGLLLLHALYQRDDHFAEHHYLVEHQYVRLITGLTTVFKRLAANHSHELSALGDLWDFDEDYNELSQESEGDDEDIQQMDSS
ncbi:ATR-interacting protein-like [Pecten maximus]|uniref:ATR-interacting protein-like n=1 Tax=Pecten maximus TaxID=6579 RepID=UPI001458368C|nr:ATR-interacting protein-like [Pecten maximus]